MDIFGFFPQTLQGADILALSGPQRYRVFMPDFFDGEPAPIEWCLPPLLLTSSPSLPHL